MQAIKILNGHDLSMLVSEEQQFEAADLNNIGITDALVPGVVLTIPTQKRIPVQAEALTKAQQKKSVRVKPGQTWIDLTLEQTGDEEKVFDVCDLNGAGITEEVTPGVIINAMEPEVEKKRIVNSLATVNTSSMYFATGNPAPEGIEYWAIEIDFVVS